MFCMCQGLQVILCWLFKLGGDDGEGLASSQAQELEAFILLLIKDLWKTIEIRGERSRKFQKEPQFGGRRGFLSEGDS